MASLILKLSGPPEVIYLEEPLKFRSRKVLALLIYLVVEGGIHNRDKLAALLWPESNTVRARASFRNTLLRLRKSLAPAGEYILVDSETVRFDASQPHHIEQDTIAEFLEGFSLPDAPEFDSWVDLQRQAHLRRLDKLFDSRTESRLEKRQFSQAITIAEQWLALDPYNETAACRLMKAHYMVGDRSSALAVYVTLEEILEKDLNVKPTRETTELAQTIRHSDSLPARQESQTDLSVIPFVGRAAEHGQLAAAFQDARQGYTQAVCVEGEAGIGKTRLVEVFLDWAVLQSPVDILRGRAYEVGGRLPYQPLVDAFRQRLDAENAPEDLLADVWLAELSQILPGLRERYPDLPLALGGNPDFTRSRLFEAVAVLGQELAARKPVILFIDDIQWADPGSLDLLHYLLRRWTENREPIFFIPTVRAENMATLPFLREWLAQMRRLTLLKRVQLQHLTDTDIRQLVSQLQGTAKADQLSGAAFSDWLQGETAGLPFFLAEMLKMLEEQKILVDGDFDQALRILQQKEQLPIPKNIRELILARLRQLSEGATALLLSAAVIGREASFERLVEIANLDDLQGLAALEELIKSRLLVETDRDQRPYRFAHDNSRDVVYTEAGEARRRFFHRRAFASLKSSGSAAEVAFHARAARMVEPAFHYSQKAGSEAMDKFAFAEAALQYEQALNLINEVERPSSERQSLYIQYGRALELSGAYAAALAHYHEMDALAQKLGDLPLRLAALVAQSTIYVTANDQNDMSRGEAACEQALALARELGDEATEATIQWNLLNVYRMTQRNDRALAAGERSLELSRKLGMKEQLAFTTNDLGYVYQANADIENMNRVLEISTSLWRELRNMPMLTDSLTSYANNMVFMGQLDRALEFSQEAQSISKSLNNPWSESFTLFTPCFVNWFRMETVEAVKTMRRCVALAQEVGFVGGMVTMSNYQAQLLLELDRIDEAIVVMRGVRQTAEQKIPLFLSGAIAAEVMILMGQGDLDAAAEILSPYFSEDPPFDLMNSFTLEYAICQYLRRRENFGRLEQYASKVIKLLLERGFVTFLPPFLYMRAAALYGQGDSSDAVDSLQEALALCSKLGTRWKEQPMRILLQEIAGK